MTKPVLTAEDKREHHDRIRKLLRDQGLDALIVGGNAWEDGKLKYLFGQYYRVGHLTAYAVFPAAGEPVLFAFTPDRPYMLRNIEAYNEDYWFDSNRLCTLENILAYLHEIPLTHKRIGLDKQLLNGTICQSLEKEFPDSTFVDSGGDLTALMRVKTKNEIACVQEAARICDAIWDSMRNFLQPGLYDYQLAAEWSRIMYEEQCDKVFNLTQIHPLDVACPCWPSMHTPKQIEKNSLVLMEISCSYGGYWTQRLGCASMGAPDPEVVKLFEAISQAHLEAGKMIKPGITTTYEVAKKMDEVISSFGYLNPSQFDTVPHGHLMGLQVDEGTLSTRAEESFVLEAGMGVQLHPGAAVPGYKLYEPSNCGAGGMWLVEPNGASPLYTHPLELMVV
ncbi:MAG: M24 family metallopeptidase [Gracilibacteraceae bacterium]|jgi:Xaa-Pro aminopeptidase|nr:M24 family metallopeptidase [Gracilibacteraceae bacterium]